MGKFMVGSLLTFKGVRKTLTRLNLLQVGGFCSFADRLTSFKKYKKIKKKYFYFLLIFFLNIIKI